MFEYGHADFFRGARINRRLKNDDGAAPHVFADGLAGAPQRPEIGLVRAVDGSRHGDDYAVRLAELFRIGRVLKTDRGAQFVARKLAIGIDAGAITCNLGLREVITDRAEVATERDGERQSDVTETDDGNGCHAAPVTSIFIADNVMRAVPQVIELLRRYSMRKARLRVGLRH